MYSPEVDLIIILKKHNLTGLIIADVNGENITRIGDLDSLPATGLIRILFGGEREVKNLYESTLEQKLPYSWGQGSVVCWVDVTSTDKIFGIFTIVKKEDIGEDYRQSKIYCAEVKTCLEKAD